MHPRQECCIALSDRWSSEEDLSSARCIRELNVALDSLGVKTFIAGDDKVVTILDVVETIYFFSCERPLQNNCFYRGMKSVYLCGDNLCL